MSDFTELPPELARKCVFGSKKSAVFSGLSLREWERLRAAGQTPPAVKLGTRKLGYTVESLIAWIEARKEKVAA